MLYGLSYMLYIIYCILQIATCMIYIYIYNMYIHTYIHAYIYTQINGSMYVYIYILHIQHVAYIIHRWLYVEYIYIFTHAYTHIFTHIQCSKMVYGQSMAWHHAVLQRVKPTVIGNDGVDKPRHTMQTASQRFTSRLRCYKRHRCYTCA